MDQNTERRLSGWGIGKIREYFLDLKTSLLSSTYSVKVSNPQNDEETVKVLLEVAKNTRGLKGRLDELVVKEGAQTVKVSNLSDIHLPSVSFPARIEVSNLKDIPQPTSTPITVEKVDISSLEKLLEGLKSSLNDIRTLLPSLKSSPISFPTIPEPKPFPKTISMAEGKDIEAEVKGLRADVAELYKLIDLKEFGGGAASEVKVTNFPPQSIPTPVTNISINSLRGLPKATKILVSTTPTALPDTALSQRRSMIVFNMSGNTIYLGGFDVTTASGFPVSDQGYSPPIDAGDQMIIYAVSATPSAEVRVFEVSNDAEGN